MWAATVAVEAYSIRELNKGDVFESKKIPMMGVAGAFVFAAQMINFAIPGAGSSGHLSGGLLLAALLGPYAGFIVLSVVLAIQALFFADGGLLALGCNIFNMGFFTCYIAYPFIMQPILEKNISRKRIFTASIIGAVCGLLLGALGVVLETTASAITELPFAVFASFMLPVHLAIGVAEGVATAFVLVFVNAAEPNLLETHKTGGSFKKIIVALAVMAVLCAGCFSRFASPRPDGLEWSIAQASNAGLELPEAEGIMNYDDSFAGITGAAIVAGTVVSAIGIAAVKRRKSDS